MNKIFLIIFVCLTLTSCKHECSDTPNLTADELSWIPYTNGQMIIYKNDTGAVDTVYAGVSYGLYGGVTDNYGCSHSSQICYVALENFIPIPVGGLDYSVSHYDQWFPDNLNANPGGNITPQNNIVLNGKSYNNVYIDTIGQKRYFSKQYGYIAFTTGPVLWIRIN